MYYLIKDADGKIFDVAESKAEFMGMLYSLLNEYENESGEKVENYPNSVGEAIHHYEMFGFSVELR